MFASTEVDCSGKSKVPQCQGQVATHTRHHQNVKPPKALERADSNATSPVDFDVFVAMVQSNFLPDPPCDALHPGCPVPPEETGQQQRCSVAAVGTDSHQGTARLYNTRTVPTQSKGLVATTNLGCSEQSLVLANFTHHCGTTDRTLDDRH